MTAQAGQAVEAISGAESLGPCRSLSAPGRPDRLKSRPMIDIDLAGKRGLVMGVANARSLGWAIAERLRAAGAELAFSYQGERLQGRPREAHRRHAGHAASTSAT